MRNADPSVEVILPSRNAFEETMLALESTSGLPLDTFSAACLEEFQHRDSHRAEYRVAQIFEPEVLDEVAMLADVSPSAVASLQHAPSSAITSLRDEVERASTLSPSEGLNLTLVLLSISRFEPAQQVLNVARRNVKSDDDLFLHAILQFIVDNRANGGNESANCFARMRSIAENGVVSPSLMLDGCTQAVVWYLKRREVHDADLQWFVHRGLEAVNCNNSQLSSSAVSSWYRGIAMLPAKVGNAGKTRSLMERARHAADETLRGSARAYDIHLRKTYLESTMKEYMYVRPDLQLAENAGRELIDLDESWGPSWAELAEVYARFGRKSEAAEAFDVATRLGAPWVRYAMRAAGDLYLELGEVERAFSRYYTLTLFPETDPRVVSTAIALAAKVRPDLTEELESLRTTNDVTGRTW